jgi:histidinol-phosphate aminotransferase
MSGAIDRRRFLTGAAAGAGALAFTDRVAIAQAMLGGTSDLTVDDIRGWGEAPGVVDIGDNENPYGPSPMAVRAVAENLMDVNRYDFTSARELANAIGRYHAFPEPPPPTSQWSPSGYPVYVEGGSSFILNLVSHRYGVRNGVGEVIEAEPAYGGVSRFIEVYRDRFGAEVTVKRVPTTADFRHDLDAMLDAVTDATTLVTITNPNNPTGTIVPQADIERFVAAVPGHVMVLIDEAYIDYVREEGYGDSVALTRRYDNVVVSRTFSKIYGLAGLRLGYAVANKALIDDLRFFGNSGGIGSINCYAGIAALDDRAFVRRVRRMTNQVKDYFYAELDRLGLDYVPSHSSFVLVDAGRDGETLARRLRERRILISRLGMDGLPHMKNFVRFSMGTPEELQVTVDALEEILNA